MSKRLLRAAYQTEGDRNISLDYMPTAKEGISGPADNLHESTLKPAPSRHEKSYIPSIFTDKHLGPAGVRRYLFTPEGYLTSTTTVISDSYFK
jgi:hypothetical protein